MLVPLPARVAVALAAAALLPALSPSVSAASISPATPIDGPSADILGVDGVAMAEDGTGGLVYRKRVAGKVNVFVSRFTDQGWQPPQRVDVGQAYNSSWPAIGAGDGGRLVVTWIHEFGASVQDRMYSAVLGPGATRFQAPIALDLDLREGIDAYPSLSMSRGGAAYLAYRVVYRANDPNLPPGTIDADVRVARFNGSYWSVLGQPMDRNAGGPMRTPTATNGPQVATDASGNGVVAWSEPDDDLIDRVYARRLFGQTPGFILQASPGTDPADPKQPLRAGPDQFDLSVSPFGETAIAYRQLPASGSSFTRPRAYVNMLPSTVAEKSGTFVGIKAIDTGGADGPVGPLGPVSVAVDDRGGFDAGIGLGAVSLDVPGTEDKVGTSSRLDDGTSVAAPDPVVQRGRGGALAAAFKLSDASGAAGVGILERAADDTPTAQTVATDGGGPVRALLSAGSGLGDAAIAFLQGEGAATTLAATAVDAPPAAFSAATPPDWTKAASVALTWDPAPSAIGDLTYELNVDGEAVASGLHGLTSTIKSATIGDGDHQVTVTATDSAGQSTSTPVASLKLDTTAPKVRVTPGRRSTVVLSDGATGDVSGVSASGSSVSWGDGKRSSGRRRLTHRYARAGSFRITVTARDRAGNHRTLRRVVRAR